jgi:hypothetical protein
MDHQGTTALACATAMGAHDTSRLLERVGTSAA